MKREWHLQLLIGIVIAAVVLIGAALLPLSAAGGRVITRLGVPRTVQQAGPTVSGDYAGGATLQWVYIGTYDITSTTPVTMDMGHIDLSLHLEQAGNVVTGYVTLDRALVFTREDTIMVTPVGPTPGPGTPSPAPQPQDIGPRVEGSFDGTTLRLVSNPFSMSLNGRQITRRFSLDTTSVEDDGATLSGTYRETIWGYDRQPSTAVGIFILRRPVYGLAQLNKRIYLPIVTK